MNQINSFIKNIDNHIANKIYTTRIKNGISRKELAKSIGISIQQLIKYEKGVNKISIGRLILLSKYLNINPSEFYLNSASSNIIFANGSSGIEVADSSQACIKLVKEISRIEDEKHQKALLVLMDTVVKSFAKISSIQNNAAVAVQCFL